MITLFDFTGDTAAAQSAGSISTDAWRAIDDRVMGGVSRSALVQADGHAAFEGVVSAENNGGFASVRAMLPVELTAEVQHLWIQTRGQTNSYYLNLHTDEALDGVSYRTDFTPMPDWSTLELPLADFRPVFRGRDVLDAPALKPERVRQIGLMIADGQYGEFRLPIRALGASS